MKRVGSLAFLLSVTLATAMSGCQESGWPFAASAPQVVSAAEGMVVSMEVPRRIFRVGEKFVVNVTIRNLLKKQQIAIMADSGAPVYVRLFRHTGLAWDQMKRYPETTTMVMTPWTLAPLEQRSYAVQLTVEPDWPTYEPLRLTAEVNGEKKIKAFATIEVVD